MVIAIDFEKPIIADNIVLEIAPKDLDDFYKTASDFDKNNLFFILLNSLHFYEGSDDTRKAAHLSFLIAYYLFISLTPPGSCDLALHYINKAILLNPISEYNKWLELIKKGN